MSGIVSAALLVTMVVGFVVGAITRQVLAIWLSDGPTLAIASGFLGVVAAGLIRNALMLRRPAEGTVHGPIPPIVILFAAVASIAGSLSGYQIALLTAQTYAWGIGALAGLFSAILMALLILAHHIDPTRVTRSSFSRSP